ncbi:ABC transporter ATP-binding protein [Micromonospora sp. NPDC048830]|uniref:ABC transporter ATP-binding protein n=1 Tax=Micromonospora sp. NPDC048830 TaxID=3364257 RepID=UPI003715DF06
MSQQELDPHAAAPLGSPLVSAQGLTRLFPAGREGFFGRRRFVHAVQGVDLEIWPGETVALVGESGSGKSTIGRLLLRLLEPTGGRVVFDGQDLTTLSREQLRRRRQEFQMVFQNPYASLNPRQSIGASLARPLLAHGVVPKASVQDRVHELLESVRLSPGRDFAARLPHELSGGQRQRVVIARAMSLGPRFVVADEPLSALDVSVRAQILELLQELRERNNLAYLMITHDLPVARSFADRVVVLYLGKIVETASAKTIFSRPLHPYTRALIDARPLIKRAGAQPRGPRLMLQGDIPSPVNPPGGCHFHTRCPFVQKERCATEVPVLVEQPDGARVACHFAREIAAGALRPYANKVTREGHIVSA